MKIEVKFGAKQYKVEFDNDATVTVGELRQAVLRETGVQPKHQKLLGKPKLQTTADDVLLSTLGFKPGTVVNRLMLIGSTTAEHAEVSVCAEAGTKKQMDEQKRLIRRLPYNFWMLGSYTGLVADAYVAGRGSPLEGCDITLNILSLDQLLNRINPLGPIFSPEREYSNMPTYGEATTVKGIEKDEDLPLSVHVLRKIFTTRALFGALRQAHGVVRRCASFAMSSGNATSPHDILEVVESCVTRLTGLSRQEWWMIPAGWRGKTAEHILFLLVTLDDPEEGGGYRVVVINRGAGGVSYHPRWQTGDKVKVCPLITLRHVQPNKILDKSFWLLLLSLWMRMNDPENKSEFVREEVFYDVLLPWLVEKVPPTEDSNSRNEEEESISVDNGKDVIHPNSSLQQNYDDYLRTCGCTSPRSRTSTVKSAITAFCWLVNEFSGHQLTAQHIKRLKYALKFEAYLRAAEDLLLLGRRLSPKCDKSFLSPPSTDSLTPALSTAKKGGEKMELGTMEEVSVLHAALNKLEMAGVRDTSNDFLTMKELMAAAESEEILFKRQDNVLLKGEQFKDKFILVYIAALDVPETPEFSELLSEAAPKLLASTAFPTEILFISLDQKMETYEKHCSMFSFPRAKFPAIGLANHLDIVSLPELLMFSPSGVLLHRSGVAALRADPEASFFPFGKCWRGVNALSYTDQKLLSIGAAVLSHNTQKRLHRKEISVMDSEKVLQLLDAVALAVQAMPRNQLVSLYNTIDSEGTTDDTRNEEGQECIAASNPPHNVHHSFLGSPALRDAVSRALTVVESGQGNASMLPLVPTSLYLGNPYSASVPLLNSIFGWERATSFTSLHKLVTQLSQTVKSLWSRAGHSSTSSRVAEQMHIIELITYTMNRFVPVPREHEQGEQPNENEPPQHPSNDHARSFTVELSQEERDVTAIFYMEDGFSALPPAENGTKPLLANRKKMDPDMQFEIMESLFYLTLSLANAWQAVETPPRNFDSERCLTAMHILVVFDAVARQQQGSEKCKLLSNLLNFDGGYYPSTTLGISNTPFEMLSATLELTRPEMLPIRSAIIRYLNYVSQKNANELFDFLMPSSTLLEVCRGSHSVNFLRLYIDNAGISLTEEAANQALSEMERLMECFCSNQSPLVAKFPEFIFFRDIVFLTKFLGTMETRETHLLHRRKELDRYARWRLSFEESTPGRQMSAGWRTTPAPPLWECVLVRGRNMDVADIRVKGFGDRELHYGEGLVLTSPIDVGRLMELTHPTEDDILHARTLPTFGGSLNQEEAETLLSFLTIPYLRIPLVLDFFASGDRSSHLFVKEVQQVLRATLFEPAAYAPPWTENGDTARVLEIPLRREEDLSKYLPSAQFVVGGGRSVNPSAFYLGTTFGLLLNELTHDPHAILEPLWHLLQQTTAIGASSVYSVHVSFILFLIEVICDVLSFGLHAVSMPSVPEKSKTLIRVDAHRLINFLEQTAYPWFDRWLTESELNDDTQTKCVVLSCRSMIDQILWKSDSIMAPLHPTNDEEAHSVPRTHLLHLLQSCAFVRSHHGFGMGLQRTQLAIQQGDEALTPEENLLRFLQAQGLRTPTNPASDLLESVKQLMLCGGRRRAVFLQISSGTYQDTVRLPNLFRHAPQSTQDSRTLKLPPCDVSENRVFYLLLDSYTAVLSYFRQLPPAELSSILEEVVVMVLRQQHNGGVPTQNPEVRQLEQREHPPETAAVEPTLTTPVMTTPTTAVTNVGLWTLGRSSDVLVGPPSSGFVFHLQTGELFWRRKELKPVPDSMSHFVDYENILGKELRQCGEVIRHQHRHWVHVVGTPYDLMEWSAPDVKENKCGERCPSIIGGEWPQKMVESALWEGIMYDRLVPVGKENGQQPWPVKSERWAIEVLRLVLGSLPKLLFFPLAPARTLDEEKEDGKEEASEMHFLTNDAPQYDSDLERATWKEFVVYKYPQPYLEIYNLVPHARRMYRSLVYSSNQKLSLHSLSTIQTIAKDPESMLTLAFQAGIHLSRIHCETTLEIHRYNALLKGREMYVPPRLLQGVLPGALLEVFAFWQGEDDILRGYGHNASNSMDNEDGGEEETRRAAEQSGADDGNGDGSGSLDHWHHFSVEVFLHGGKAFLVRRNDRHYTPIFDHLPHHQSPVLQKKTSAPLSESEGEEKNVDPTLFSSSEWERNMALLRAAIREPHEICAVILQRLDGDVNAALQWSTDGKNAPELQNIRDTTPSLPLATRGVHADPNRPSGFWFPSVSQEGSSTAPSRELELSLRLRPDGADQVLVNLRGCRHLQHFLSILSGLEDASHTLVWATPVDESRQRDKFTTAVDGVEGLLRIDSIELPRLRARFVVEHEGGVSSAPLHLFLADYPGWRLAEPNDLHAHTLSKLCEFRETFQQSIVLCNGIHEVAVMVPNHSFSSMIVTNDPFHPFLLFDRSNFSWQQAVTSPFYLYTLHSCGSIIIPQTLSASLYLAALQCGTQHYAQAMTTLESCYTDTVFSHEESYMCDLFQFTESDRYPDANAVRLKMVHALQHSPNKYEWMVLSRELNQYLEMAPHVSADCRLSFTEVIDLIKRCEQPTTLVRTQLELHAARVKLPLAHRQDGFVLPSSPAAHATVSSASLTAPTIQPAGICWDRLLLQPWGRITPQKPHRITYMSPTGLDSATGVIEALWKDTLLLDEESGSNARLGFFFLYNLKVGALKVCVGKDDCTQTFADLMSRWFHLRHARWGREHQEQGEIVLGPSWCATVLQLMTLCPKVPWPKANLDREGFILRRGINLRSDLADVGQTIQGNLLQNSTIPDHFARIDQLACRCFSADEVGEDNGQDRVRACREYRQRRYRQLTGVKHLVEVPMDSSTSSSGWKGRLLHEDTANSVIQLPQRQQSNGEGVGMCLPETLFALCQQPLLEVKALRQLLVATSSTDENNNAPDDNEEKDVEAGSKSGGGVAAEASSSLSLPFNLKEHPLASSSIARTMLERLEQDFQLYSAQIQEEMRETHHRKIGLSCLPSGIVETILFSTEIDKVSSAFNAAVGPLQQASDALRQLRAQDQQSVAAVTQAILAKANAAPSGVVADASPLRVRKDDSEGLSPSEMPSWSTHRLMLYHHDRVPLRMEWLCGGLLSTKLEKEISTQNPFHGSIEELRSDIAILMLLSNRSHLAMQALAAVQQVELFLQLCRLLRGIGDECVNVNAATQLVSITQRTRELYTLFAIEISPAQLEELLQQCAGYSDAASAQDPGAVPQLPPYVAKLLQNRLQHLAATAGQLLSAKRFYVERVVSETETEEPLLPSLMSDAPSSSGGVEGVYRLDPRFLLMEFLFNILLRRRQVEMTRWFVNELQHGRSRVQQMIMGQGKTSVVAPLLALILADGKQLVTQVMPTALVEQTRAVLRRCFGVVIVKHVFTLQFDRSRGDDSSTGSWEVEALLTKLQSAVVDRAVVVAAPESLKSLFLKYIEQLHLLDSTKASPSHAGKDARGIALGARAQEREKARARIVDAIAPILALWRDGVLLMDEVDVLLHPLRSELNFPVGEKHAIDMSGPRWALPIHLLDLVCEYKETGGTTTLLFAERYYLENQQKRLQKSQKRYNMATPQDSTGVQFAEENLGAAYHAVVQSFHQVLSKGVRQHALQREPHLVLLDLTFYKEQMLPLLITWAQLWVFEELHTYLNKQVLPCSNAWKTFSLMQEMTLPFFTCEERLNDTNEEQVLPIIDVTPVYGVKLLHLAHDWVHRLLPHVLAKINRVSFGVLQPRDMRRSTQQAIELMPLSRQLTAVPFVAKDVPSTSSEFAHPDVAIGLTILAFRYEGLRLEDTRRLLQELKKEFSQQLGPKEQRHAALLYQRWVERAMEDRSMNKSSDNSNKYVREGEEQSVVRGAPFLEVVPLSQVQLTDVFQLRALHRLFCRVPDVVYHYLSSHVFPRTMLFHQLKISACGHELGSSMLFGRRLGFSGTPSNLLPIDLGACEYEAGSDARVLSVLTNSDVVSVEIMDDNWTPLRVLDRIAAAQPPFYALIDAGALITNMNNADVAAYLLTRLPAYVFDGVVYLDDRDQQMVLQRMNGMAVPVAQCGIPVSRRFTFFDQVHTTGTDVKQAASATAVMTLGKDLTFRDYAQAAYRMRSIGNGQRLCLYLIPEVVSRLKNMLRLAPSSVREGRRSNFETGDLLRDVPAWLMLNSMKIESLQFLKLSLQELSNVWRKMAYGHFLADSLTAVEHPDIFTEIRRAAMFRVDRAALCAAEVPGSTIVHSTIRSSTGEILPLPSLAQMRRAIEEFREIVAYPVPESIEKSRHFQSHLEELLAYRPALLAESPENGEEGGAVRYSASSESIMTEVVRRFHFFVEQIDDSPQSGNQATMNHMADLPLNAEMVHEQEAEEEQQQEAEEEEQRITFYSRDDEKPMPWRLETLKHCGYDLRATVRPSNGACFYQVRGFTVHQNPPGTMLRELDPHYLLSDNYFRLEWSGVGERRLKNALLYAEWVPSCTAKENGEEEEAVAGSVLAEKCYGLISLVEAESLRWLLHRRGQTSTASMTAVTLRLVSTGRCIASSSEHAPSIVLPHNASTGERPMTLPHYDNGDLVTPAALLFRFLNNDMFFTDAQLEVLAKDVLRAISPNNRLQFFKDCLSSRRRLTQRWEETPVSSLFFSPEEEAFRPQVCCLLYLQSTLEAMGSKMLESAELQHLGMEIPATLAKRCETIESQVHQCTEALLPYLQSAEDNNGALISLAAAAQIVKQHFPSESRSVSEDDVEDMLAYCVWKAQQPPCVEEEEEESTAQAGPTFFASTAILGEIKGSVKVIGVAQLYEALPWINPAHIHTHITAHIQRISYGKGGKEPWHCPTCTLRNEAGFSVCAVCGTARPNETIQTPISTGAGEDGPWACEACTFVNDSRRQPVCSICLGPNPNVLEEVASPAGMHATGFPSDSMMMCPEGYWVCALEHGGCSKVNPKSEFYCSACEKGRPGLSHVRF